MITVGESMTRELVTVRDLDLVADAVRAQAGGPSARGGVDRGPVRA